MCPQAVTFDMLIAAFPSKEESQTRMHNDNLKFFVSLKNGY